MLKVLGEFLVIYLLYKIIFDLIIPGINLTKKTKQMMDDIHQQNHNSSNTNTTASSSTSKKKINDDEYIDYEEVK